MKEYFIVSRFLLLKAMLIEDLYEVFQNQELNFLESVFSLAVDFLGHRSLLCASKKLLNVCDKQKKQQAHFIFIIYSSLSLPHT